MKSLQLPFGEQQSRFGIQHRHISSSLMTFHVSSSSLSSPSSPSSSSSFSSSSFSCAAAPAVFERQTLLGENATLGRLTFCADAPRQSCSRRSAAYPDGRPPLPLPPAGGEWQRAPRPPAASPWADRAFYGACDQPRHFHQTFSRAAAKGGMCGSQGHTSLAACRRGAAWARARCSAGTFAASPPPSPCAPTHRGWP